MTVFGPFQLNEKNDCIFFLFQLLIYHVVWPESSIKYICSVLLIMGFSFIIDWTDLF